MKIIYLQHRIFSYGTTAKLSTSELAKPVQDVFRINSASDNSENRKSFNDRFPNPYSIEKERTNRSVARTAEDGIKNEFKENLKELTALMNDFINLK